MTPGAYIRSVREAAQVTLVDLALGLDSTPPVSHHSRVELLFLVEADLVPVSLSTAFTLSALLAIDTDLLAELVERHSADTAVMPRLRRASAFLTAAEIARAAPFVRVATA